MPRENGLDDELVERLERYVEEGETIQPLIQALVPMYETEGRSSMTGSRSDGRVERPNQRREVDAVAVASQRSVFVLAVPVSPVT